MASARPKLSDWKATVLPGAAALLAVLALQVFGFPPLTRATQLVFDSYVRAKPRDYQPAPVKIVDIDEESIKRFGQWPWPRTEIARLVRELGDSGAAVIAFDVAFSEADRTSPARIAEQLRKAGENPPGLAALSALPDNDTVLTKAIADYPVVTGLFLTGEPTRAQARPTAGFAISGSAPGDAVPSYPGAVLALPQFEAAATGKGSLTLKGDADAIVRKTPLVMRQGDQLMPSLSLEALRVAQGAGAVLVKTSDGSGNMGARAESEIVSLKVGTFEVPTTPAGELYMYFTPDREDRIIPAWQVLSGAMSPAQREEALAGQIVFVGAGAIGLRDLVSTPLKERDLGVMVHAQAAEQMILGKFLTRPDWAVGLERALVLVLGLTLLFLLPRLGAARGAVLGAALALIVLAGSWLAFDRALFLLDPVYPILAVLAVYVTETVLTYYREEQRRSYIHAAFDRYLSPELVQRIAADPGQLELGGEEREMTVLFCDIRSFSRISESLSPQQIISFLIGFLTPMCDILLKRRATIDKFIGDAILAFWNAPLDDPDQHTNAARGALEMVARLDMLNREMPGKEGQPWPGEVKIGIGLNSGPCCVGNMGSKQRLSYSLIGDTVNLASRIEGLTKYYGVAIALGEALARELPGFALIELDLVRVVGREQPERVFALIGDEILASEAAFVGYAAGHAEMLAAYRARDWEGALARLDRQAKAAATYGLGKLYGLYRERIAALRAAPPGGDWDGVYTASEK